MVVFLGIAGPVQGLFAAKDALGPHVAPGESLAMDMAVAKVTESARAHSYFSS